MFVHVKTRVTSLMEPWDQTLFYTEVVLEPLNAGSANRKDVSGDNARMMDIRRTQEVIQFKL